ncbi:hypothetical protein ACLOJK_020463 [Asimina triloba]
MKYVGWVSHRISATYVSSIDPPAVMSKAKSSRCIDKVGTQIAKINRHVEKDNRQGHVGVTVYSSHSFFILFLRFGLSAYSKDDEEAKKKARLARFAGNSKSDSGEEAKKESKGN